LLAQAPPFNPDVVDLSLFPEHEEGEERDDEGNLVINGVPLKKVDVEPLALEDFIKEEWPRLEPKVYIVYTVRHKVKVICISLGTHALCN
jgi:hypothetical protein